MLEYLRRIRKDGAHGHRKQEIDAALLQLYADGQSSNLYKLLRRSDCQCQLDPCETMLQSRKKYYALGLLFQLHQMESKALDVWIQIESEELTDSDFPGLSLIIDTLLKSSDSDVIFKYAEYVLSKEPRTGLQLFKRPGLLNHDAVLEFLGLKMPKSSNTFQEYLEYLVHQCGTSEYETRLAELYISQLDTPEHTEGMARLMRSFKEKSLKKRELKMSFEVYMESQDLLYPWVKAKLLLLGYLRSMKSLQTDLLAKMMRDEPRWTLEFSVLHHKVTLMLVCLEKLMNYSHFCAEQKV